MVGEELEAEDMVKSPSPGPLEDSGGENASPSRIEALIHLLGDDSPKVLGSVWRHLERIGSGAVPFVREAARNSQDPAVRREAGRFVTEWQRRAVIERWEAFCTTGDVSLEEGVLLVSRSEYPAAGEAECLGCLEEYAGVLRRRLATARTADAAFQKLAQFLGGELGFSGGDVDFLCPAGSYLHRVLERRRGLPILLSVVYLLVARRLDLELVGVSMPRHFVVKYRTSAGERFLDPFHGGKVLERADCVKFLERSGIVFQERLLGAASDRAILSRILGNLLRAYHARQDRSRLARVLGMLRQLEKGPCPPMSASHG